MQGLRTGLRVGAPEMRVTRHATDTDALPWEPLNGVLERKVLNGDPENGPHTLLLRSGPRAPGPDFAQYHPIDEELYCLGGDFTFDGTTWFRAGSYAFYPAYFVHGTRVHVRGGYFVYLRLSGESELFKVTDPESDVPYYIGGGVCRDHAVQFADAASASRDAQTAVGALRAAPLHIDSANGAGSTLLTLTEEGAGQLFRLETTSSLEVLTLGGSFATGGGASLKARGYLCEVGARPSITLECRAPGSLMISHEGALSII